MVYCSKLLCSLKVPKAAEPRAWTTRSAGKALALNNGYSQDCEYSPGIRSWSKRLIFSRAAWSSSSIGPVLSSEAILSQSSMTCWLVV